MKEDKIIIFKKYQLEFLLKHMRNSKITKKFDFALENERIFEGNYPTNRYPVILSQMEKDELLDELSNLLTLIGINKMDEINKDGLMIEDIIGIVSYPQIEK